MTQSNPPTPRRCRRILEAHRLRCTGLSLTQIAAEMGCARSTVAAYLRDLKLHYAHILRSVAADELLNLLPAFTEPDSPVPDRESAKRPQNPPPLPKIGPQYPASWDNPFGYTPAGATVLDSGAGRLRRLTRPEPAIPYHRRL